MLPFRNPITKYVVFAVLNIPRGIYLTISLIILPVYLYEVGISLQKTTLLIGITTTPWLLKFFWGYTIDYYSNYGRKTFIFLGGISAAICLFLLSFIHPLNSIILFSIILLIGHISLLFLDISQIAWAIDITKKHERGKINGTIFGAYFLTMAISSTLLGLVAKELNYATVFIFSGIIIVLISIFIIFFEERKKEKNSTKKLFTLYALKKDYLNIITAFALISSIGGGIITLITPIYIRIELNLDIVQIGLISSLFLIFRAVGSLIGGIGSDRFGRKKTLLFSIGMSILFIPMFIFTKSWQTIAPLYSIIGFLLGVYQSTTSTIFMDITNKDTCATQYSVYASLFNLGRIMGEIFTGTLIITISFSKCYLLIGWFFILTILIAYFIKIK